MNEEKELNPASIEEESYSMDSSRKATAQRGGRTPRPRFNRLSPMDRQVSRISIEDEERSYTRGYGAERKKYGKSQGRNTRSWGEPSGGYQHSYDNRERRDFDDKVNENRSSYKVRNDRRGFGNFNGEHKSLNRGNSYSEGGNNWNATRSAKYSNRPAKNNSQYSNRQHFGNYDPNAKYSRKKRIEYSEANIDPTAPVRLNKFLANAGVCSRRDADKYIEAGVVSVNGTIVTELGTKVLRTDDIKFHDQSVRMEKKVYVLLNKPKDYVTTSDDPQKRKIVMDLVRGACAERIYPVGRLDRNTTGVLLLTNDGDMAARLTHPKFLKKKIYHVYLNKNVTAADMQQILSGVVLDDGEVHADAIEYASDTDKKQIGIEIHSGKNRIVRRIFEYLGYKVMKLDRVYFAGLTKKNLRRGDWRYLTEEEVNMLRIGAFE